jgi:hypothetical protein
MSDTTAPNPLSLAAQLPVGAYYYLVHTLRGTLPRLLKDTPENRARRDEDAMARVAALCPANIAEAEVAALHVANAEHAKACLLDAQRPDIELLLVLKCRAQAASMSRLTDNLMRTLLRMQAARQKREANQETHDRAAWAEHCALNLMAEALSPPPPPATIAEPPPPPARPAQADQEPAPDAIQGLPPGSGPEVAAQSVTGEGAEGEAKKLQLAAEEVSAQSVADEGAGGEAKVPQPATQSTQPESAPVKQPLPALTANDHDPRTDSPIRLTDRFAHLPDDDPIQALIAALKPASVTRNDQPAEAAEDLAPPPPR